MSIRKRQRARESSGAAFAAKKAIGHRVIPISSNLRIVLFALLASSLVLITSLLIQWLVYYDWLHQTGPLRLIGTCLATVLTFCIVLRWQLGINQRHLQMLRRFETIARMNDRIRNSLQTIECVTYLSRPEATRNVKDAVGAIDIVLREVLNDITVLDTNIESPVEKERNTKKQSA